MSEKAPRPFARTRPAAADAAAHGRVRRSMYLAFLVLAALALLQASYGQRFEEARRADADIVDAAGEQRTFTQQMGRLAAMAGGDTPALQHQAEMLAQALDQSRSDALRVEALISGQLKAGESAQPAVAAALEKWQSVRERLWYRCDLLVQALGDADPVRVEAAARAVQREADSSLLAAATLADALREAARERSREQLRLLHGGAALTLVLLGLLALFVVEPTARAVRGQVQRLRAQADDLERLALVAERTDNLVMLTDARRRITWVNDAYTRITGVLPADAAGQPATRLLRGAQNDPTLLGQVRRALRTSSGLRAELRITGALGTERWLDCDIQPLHDEQGGVSGFVLVGSDVTERRELQDKLRHTALTDALTGLPNRNVVLERVQRALAHAQRHPGYGFAVLFMDFDRFKQVNDTLGHAVGDALLRQIAARIEGTLRPGDAVGRVASQLQTAARIGGDEFVVVLEGMRSVDDALVVAERLLAALSEPYLVGTLPVQSSASIGIVTSDHAADTADKVLRDADTAMYEAKRAGRGRCVLFDRSMHERVVQALEVENDLRRALREQELFAVYQPVVDLRSGTMVAVEALVRWQHPTRGIVPPARFIAVAEECGLIDAIGQAVLQMACRQFVVWRRELGERAPRQLAVNLSRAQLQLPGLVAEVKALLQENGMEPHELQLEVTESLAAQDERVQATLRHLKALGVKLALDDFGTGYSSLACLHQLPVDTVKIDRSFVMHAETVEYHRVLIEATIRVAQTLGMTTVAEGIETPGQAALMQRLRCLRGQGYLFSRPLAAGELSRWALEPATAFG